MTSIKIVPGRRGYHLKVNGLFICHDFPGKGDVIKGIQSKHGIPYGATEWVSVMALRNFWKKYMSMVLAAKPHSSVWGQLVPLENVQP